MTERGPRRYESAASLQSRREPILAAEERLRPFDDQMFVGVYDAIKRPTVALEDLAVSTEQNGQTGRYPAPAGAFLLSIFAALSCLPA